MPHAFVDTNILVYAADESAPTARKTRIARELLLQDGQSYDGITVVNPFA